MVDEEKTEGVGEVNGVKATEPVVGRRRRKPIFEADLELTAITREYCRYRVINPEGVVINAFSHLQISRFGVDGKPVFPVDDDFSIDFLTRDLLAQKGAKVGSRGPETDDSQIKKQAEFKAYMKRRVVIY